MKVLGIGGSPKMGGNTDTLLDKALEGAKSAGADIEKIILSDLDFKACDECGRCDKTGICAVQDDMRLVYRKLADADAVIVASPIFFGSISAQVKAMIDRLQCLWVLKHVLHRVVTEKGKRRGVFLCVGGSDQTRFFENAKSLIKIFFGMLDMEYFGDLCFLGIDKKTSIKHTEGALEKAFALGRALAEKNDV